MRFQRHHRFEFQDTPRKRAAFFAKHRREREAMPLLSEQIAQEQETSPTFAKVRLSVSSVRPQVWI
jgi:hypothetical protein